MRAVLLTGLLTVLASTSVAANGPETPTRTAIVEQLSQPHRGDNPQGKPLPRRLRGSTATPANTRGLVRVKTPQGDTTVAQLPALASTIDLRIEFDSGSARLRPSSLALVQTLGDALTDPRFSGQAFLIAGHTDADGDDEYNLGLSLRRANTVRDYLLQHTSLTPGQLKVVGFGETTPLASNHERQGKQQNRRVEVQRLEAPEKD
ncbi:OmpA family protein [Ferrimonas balearica]|uniref:OmpA family protein n=1 Tax=Ferrimonas balearica TaxID=44012 RepID=UPI001C55CC2E|nr:OmpA family protein [Ferrimonas balearica]MBW3140287.1 OmpA family protein [Ferrimonas balearica]